MLMTRPGKDPDANAENSDMLPGGASREREALENRRAGGLTD